MTDGNRSSGSAEQAENTVNVNCSLKKSAVLEIDLLWGEGQWVWGKGAMSVGRPTEPRRFFQYLK